MLHMKDSADNLTIDIEEQIKSTPATQTLGYIRVSTKEQNTARQLANIQCDEIFVDKISGAETDRPQLEELKRHARRGDTVVVHSLDRLSRDLNQLLELVDFFKKKQVNLHFITENIKFYPASNNPMDILTFHIFGGIAQYQRAIIKATQREGIEKAKEEGAYKGRVPALQKEKLEQLKEALKNKTDDYTYTQMAKDFGITYMTLCRYRKKLEKELEAA